MATKKTTNKKKASLKKVSKLDTMSRTTGKNYDNFDESVAKAKELEKVLGIPKMNPFKTTDARILDERMASMNLTDLQKLAVKAGVFPSGNPTVLRNKLRKALKALGGSGTVQITNKPFIDPTDPKNKAIVDLYKQGF
jgi:hypothetical protein